MNGTFAPALPRRSTILVVEEDNDTRRCLTRNLRRFGYRLLVAANVEDAVEWVSGDVYIHADLLLIDLIGKLPEEALIIGRGLRARARYPNQTPLVVMPERVAKDLEGTDEKVGANDWICYYEDSDQLQRLLIRLLRNPTHLPLR
jgi:DNA-binding response OmpR family regulator